MIEPELSGRVALVTGGSGGIGAELCRRLGSSGLAVAVHYSATGAHADGVVATIESTGGRAIAVRADLRAATAPERLVAEVTEALGEIDVLVANAGPSTPGSYEEIDATAFDEAVAVHLRAPYLLARAVLPGMRERGFGRVLFISSVTAFIAPHGLVRQLAAQVAADGVTVNALAAAGSPAEVADLAMAMLRNGYLTNQVIGVDGGLYRH